MAVLRLAYPLPVVLDLSAPVSHWIAKNPDSALVQHVKPSVDFEVDYAEFLDDALVEAWELKCWIWATSYSS